MSKAEGLTKEQFLLEETLKRAFIRSIEIIGEASEKVSTELKNLHPQVEWRAMAGMRDRLIQDYLGVDYDIVWDVVQNKIPILRQQKEEILRKESAF